MPCRLEVADRPLLATHTDLLVGGRSSPRFISLGLAREIAGAGGTHGPDGPRAAIPTIPRPSPAACRACSPVDRPRGLSGGSVAARATASVRVRGRSEH